MTQESGALAYYQAEHHVWWFIPTVPEGRKWRGPYRNEEAMTRAVVVELGDEVFITTTERCPDFLLAK